jgi:hypothetical protein
MELSQSGSLVRESCEIPKICYLLNNMHRDECLRGISVENVVCAINRIHFLV